MHSYHITTMLIHGSQSFRKKVNGLYGSLLNSTWQPGQAYSVLSALQEQAFYFLKIKCEL